MDPANDDHHQAALDDLLEGGAKEEEPTQDAYQHLDAEERREQLDAYLEGDD
jgi:hypothetical protein